MLIGEVSENTNPIISIAVKKYEIFLRQVEGQIKTPSLAIFKNKTIFHYILKKCNEIFNEEIKAIKFLLENPKTRIAALDVPEINIIDRAMDAVVGVAAIMGIFNNIGQSNIDPINETPFTLHTASRSSGKLLASTEYTPEVKLGYHNDGLIRNGKLELPKNIVLYNLHIGYHKPGNFKWIPTALWKDEKYFNEKLKNNDNIKINIKLTPYFNLHQNQALIKSEYSYVEIPISSVTEDEKRRFFLNGSMLEGENKSENIELINAIRKSLEGNPINISIKQKERRAIYLRNIDGFHARDMFEDPIEDIDLTRVFLRSVDVNSETYPSTQVNIEEVDALGDVN